MQFWESKLIADDPNKIEAELNKLGKDMWEPVGITPLPSGRVACLLKREMRTSPSVGAVKVSTRNSEPYVPGMPQGTEVDGDVEG